MGVSFRKGACGWCVRTAKWLPVVFVGAVVVWSYYAYVVHLCFLTVMGDSSTGGDGGGGGWLIAASMLVPYHGLLGLFLWAYFRTVLTPPGSVPARFRLTPQEMDEVESTTDPRAALEQLAVVKDVPVSMRSPQGEVRYCTECCHIKPDRTHHCSVCGECVLKMDHHCPWVNNCVAFNNYKFFILFLGYSVAYCMFIALTSLKYFLQFWSTADSSHGKFHVLFLFFVSGMFCLSLSSLFVYHLFLVSRNQTTLESFRAPVFRRSGSLQSGAGVDKMGFHLGTANNFQEVFGDNRLLWALPVFSSFGDGIVFPRREDGPASLDLEMATGGSSHASFFRHHVAPSSLPSSANGGLLGSRRAGAGVSEDELVPMMSAVRFDSEMDDEDDDEQDCNRVTLGSSIAGKPPAAGAQKMPLGPHYRRAYSDSSSASEDNEDVAIVQGLVRAGCSGDASGAVASSSTHNVFNKTDGDDRRSPPVRKPEKVLEGRGSFTAVSLEL